MKKILTGFLIVAMAIPAIKENNADMRFDILILNEISKEKRGFNKDSLSSQETVNGIWIKDPISGCGDGTA